MTITRTRPGSHEHDALPFDHGAKTGLAIYGKRLSLIASVGGGVFALAAAYVALRFSGVTPRTALVSISTISMVVAFLAAGAPLQIRQRPGSGEHFTQVAPRRSSARWAVAAAALVPVLATVGVVSLRPEVKTAPPALVGPPAHPSVTVGQGRKQIVEPVCTHSSCGHVTVTLRGFEPGVPYRVQLSSQDGPFMQGSEDLGLMTITTDAHGDGFQECRCVFGYPGQWVQATVSDTKTYTSRITWR